MTDNEIIKALVCCKGRDDCECGECPLLITPMKCTNNAVELAVGLINRQKAELERLHKLQKPTETSGFKIENGKVVFYTNILNGYRHEYANLDEVVKNLNLMLQNAYASDEAIGHYKGKLQNAKTEAIKEFVEKVDKILCLQIGPSKRVFWKITEDIKNLLTEMVGDDNA